MACARAGICIPVAGQCDQLDKNCCEDLETQAQYCSSTDAATLGCEIAPAGNAPIACKTCGGEDEVCCLPSGTDVRTISPRALPTAPPLCGDDLGCMFDEGNPNSFGKCALVGPCVGLRARRRCQLWLPRAGGSDSHRTQRGRGGGREARGARARRCVTCGQEEGDPCCWQKRSVTQSDLLGTASDTMAPFCVADGLGCQGPRLATDSR